MSQATFNFDTRRAIQDQFESFDKANPRVWELFVRFAEQAKAAGQKRYSSDAILHRIRWHINIETHGDDFKINNNFSSRYARKLVAERPEFEGFFSLRELKSE